ncbi:MAG: PIN domain-containing protein [Candidatus Aminicenantes bacterium]|nr:PIN domain-containing protein [Candidatus Aminicenantes bacterium]NIM79053.1 PIN domain-containing protein [Candidatus Aminicenantes bacterium]NIN18332.1 PIN domain-containing protein [Candidatus Aminicenantes bacterium]NIN42219.1 PIN domain-containing protein [Candidatus Aminicenantes bacterium]NIN84985.1 PIN domain-containing protein [Candidatus Aminicenantes bacterium]
MPDRIFIDSNIFIYAKVQESGESKHEIAQKFLESVSGEIIISTQVLSEFYYVLNRYKIDDSIIQDSINEILEDVTLRTITLDTIKSCWKIKTRYRYSYYDSLIIASALENNCSLLYSEDMQHEQLIHDELRIMNPFKK